MNVSYLELIVIFKCAYSLFSVVSCPTSIAGTECSGHGVCWSMAEIAADDALGVVAYGSSALAQATTAWDHNIMKGCICNTTSWSVGYGDGQYQLSEYYQPDCSLSKSITSPNVYTFIDLTLLVCL